MNDWIKKCLVLLGLDRGFKFLNKFIATILALLLLVFGYMYLTKSMNKIIDYHSSNQTYKTIQEEIYEDTDNSVSSSFYIEDLDEELKKYTNNNFTKITNRHNNLPEFKQENDDLIGWINVNETIDYPVMQNKSDDELYYRKDFNKKYSYGGSIFVDGACNTDSNNIVLYGHHMNDGSMFASLANYSDKDYFNQHKYIQFDNLKTCGIYEVIGYSTINANKNNDKFLDMLSLNSLENYQDFIAYAKENNFTTEITVNDKILTMITCEYSYKNGRFLVFAKKITDLF